MAHKAQSAIEYLIIVGFTIFIIIIILGMAFFYSGSINDRIRFNQISLCAARITSASESVFYAGIPSRATISCYLPESVKNIEVIENNLIFTIQTSSGLTRTAFSANVPVSGNLSQFSGIRKIRIVAEQSQAYISLV